MTKRRVICLLLLGAVTVWLAALVLMQILRHEPEPSYAGRTLTQWELAYGGSSRVEAEAAIRAIGTNAIPCAIRWMSERPHQRLFFIGQENLARATTVLDILGDGARAAIPALEQLVNDRDPEIRILALERLVALGADPRITVPAAIQILNDTNIDVQMNPKRKSEDKCVRARALDLLGEKLEIEQESALHIFAHLTNDQNHYVAVGAKIYVENADLYFAGGVVDRFGLHFTNGGSKHEQ